jgi:hypothetical protein
MEFVGRRPRGERAPGCCPIGSVSGRAPEFLSTTAVVLSSRHNASVLDTLRLHCNAASIFAAACSLLIDQANATKCNV